MQTYPDIFIITSVRLCNVIIFKFYKDVNYKETYLSVYVMIFYV